MPYKLPGKVYTGSLSMIKRLSCDEIWLITRGGDKIKGVKKVTSLAPSPTLYHEYINHWKDTEPQSWWPIYQARFEEELNTREKREALIQLWQLLKAGKKIALLCYCPDANYCHRTIIGNLLRSKGVEVIEINPPVLYQLPLFNNLGG